jgi:hypothetical protein
MLTTPSSGDVFKKDNFGRWLRRIGWSKKMVGAMFDGAWFRSSGDLIQCIPMEEFQRRGSHISARQTISMAEPAIQSGACRTS